MGSDRVTRRSAVHRALEPTAVAVVGASRDEDKRGYMILDALDAWGFEGDVFPVNPKYEGETICGFEVYPSVSAIGKPVDLACIVTPAGAVPDVLEDCGTADVAAALVVAAGFDEIGNDHLQERTLDVARKHDIRLIGPNTNGLINVHHGLDLLARKDIPRGSIAMISQSGNIASGLVYEAIRRGGEGFSFYISVGNESDITFDEYLPYLATHEESDVVMCYVEGMSNGRAFLREVSTFVREKPVTVLKGGLTDAGKQSAESHTASIAGNGAVVDDVYRQAGVVRVERSDELLAVSDALANLPPADGPNVAILSDGGGHATHAADTLVEHGLEIPQFEPETQRYIREQVPEQAPNVANPVDVLTLEYDVGSYADCAAAILDDPNIDGLLLCGYFGGYGLDWGEGGEASEVEVAHRLADLAERSDKPVVAQTMFAGQDSPAVEVLEDSRIPVLESINTATRCLAALETYGGHLRSAHLKSDFVVDAPVEPSDVVGDALAEGRTRLSEYEAKRLLGEYGAPVTPFERASTPAEAVDAAAAFDGSVAMKVLSRDVLHKSEVGGVALDVPADDVRSTFDELTGNARDAVPETDVEGVLVSPMVEDGVEVIVGITRDEEVGPVVMFGLGGVFVEVLEDVSFRALPVTEFDAREMIAEIDAAEILEGTRGRDALDRDALVDLLLTVSDLAGANPEIAELDVNPAIVSGEGIEIVDAAATLESESDRSGR